MDDLDEMDDLDDLEGLDDMDDLEGARAATRKFKIWRPEPLALMSFCEFPASGEMYERFPKAAAKQIEIRVVHKFAPNSEGEKFLRLAGNFVRELGFHFSSGYLSDFEGDSHRRE